MTALEVPGSDVLTQGAGALNGDGAVTLAGAIDTHVPDGSSWLTTGLSTGVSTIASESYAWSSRIVWGDLSMSVIVTDGIR